MQKNIAHSTTVAKDAAFKVYFIAKIVFIVAVVFTSTVGTYVIANAQLRNQTIDFAQNQHAVQAQGPKAN